MSSVCDASCLTDVAGVCFHAYICLARTALCSTLLLTSTIAHEIARAVRTCCATVCWRSHQCVFVSVVNCCDVQHSSTCIYTRHPALESCTCTAPAVPLFFFPGFSHNRRYDMIALFSILYPRVQNSKNYEKCTGTWYSNRCK